MNKYFEVELNIGKTLTEVKTISTQVKENNQQLAQEIKETKVYIANEKELQSSQSARKSSQLTGKQDVEQYEKDHILKLIKMAREKGEHNADIAIRER